MNKVEAGRNEAAEKAAREALETGDVVPVATDAELRQALRDLKPGRVIITSGKIREGRVPLARPGFREAPKETRPPWTSKLATDEPT